LIYTSHDSAGFIKVLSFLKSHNSEYLSGQDVSDLLKISRVAVWKHIKKIRALGYKIESKQKLGYRLIKDTTLPLPWEITDNLKTKLIGKKTYYFDSIDSTQNFAQRLASDHNENGSVVVARKQITGRGRHKRRWLSPQGGIWLSVILQPSFDISVATVFPLAVGLALANTIEQSYKIKPSLKWPNDVTIDGKKVAGILIDASIEATKIEYLVLGVGINFQINAKDIEKFVKLIIKNGMNSKMLERQKKFIDWKAAYLKSAREQPRVWAVVLKDLRRNIPHGVWLTELETGSGGALRIAGGAPDEALVTEFMGNLKESPHFSSVGFTYTEKDQIGNVPIVRFEVVCRVI